MTVKTVFTKVAEFVGTALLGLVVFLGYCLNAQAEAYQKEVEIERKVAQRNFEAEQMIIKRDDTENLKGHVMRIIRDDKENSLFGKGYDGRRLLKKEGDLSKEEFNKKLYNYVIEHGL